MPLGLVYLGTVLWLGNLPGNAALYSLKALITIVVFACGLGFEFRHLSRKQTHKMVAPVVGRPLSQVAFSEAKRNWPFVFGFGVTFALVFKLSASLDR